MGYSGVMVHALGIVVKPRSLNRRIYVLRCGYQRRCDMPALEEKRRRKKEIEDILVDHRNVGSQGELVELLAERGTRRHQSADPGIRIAPSEGVWKVSAAGAAVISPARQGLPQGRGIESI